MDIGAWLRNLGLERYEQAFQDNEIDARSLPQLTAEDLKKMGVTAIGHRRLLLQAIADLQGNSSSEVEPTPRPERRQLTVMFVDLVGSTELAGRLDPKDHARGITASAWIAGSASAPRSPRWWLRRQHLRGTCMKIRHLLLAFSLLALALGAGIVVLAYSLQSTFVEVEIAQQRRYQSFLLADELRQSSDDLTRFARTYVVTGDAKYEQFFDEVRDIRDGTAPRPDGYESIYWDFVAAGVDPGGGRGERSALASRMLAAGFTTEEFSKLKEAENRSNELIRIEQVAMNAIKGRFDDGTGSFTIEKPPDLDLAINLLHGEQYHAAKAAIMQPIAEFMSMMDERTAAALDSVEARSRELIVVILVLSTALVASVAIASLMIYRRLVRPSGRLLAVAQEIAQGHYDVRSGLSSRDELGQLAQGFDRMVERLMESLAQARQATAEVERKTGELSAAYAQIEEELEAAQSLQRAILPKGFPRCAEFTGHALMWPARQLAGDFYDVLELPDGRLGVLIADVSGKGVPAAFFMGISRTVLRSATREGQSPGTCLALANDALCRTNPMDLFVTVFYGILNPRDGTFFYANGGHTSPLLVRNGAGAPVPLEGTGSFVLGGLEGIPYPERSVQLEPGDAVLLYTDGVTEAQNAAGEAFAEARLIRAAGETRGLDPGAMATHVTEAVRAFTGSAALADDLTCLVLCYLGGPRGHQHQAVAARLTASGTSP